MKALVVYCHPNPESFTHAVLGVVLERLNSAGAEVEVIDLYARGFEPVMSRAEHAGYEVCPTNRRPVEEDADTLLRCDTLIFVYPTWWYGLPAMLKGWLDRVLLPDVAFMMPNEENSSIRPGLQHIERLGVFTTCGASRWLTWLVGAPGKRTLMRGVGFLCAKPLKTAYAAHFLMDSSTQDSREKHLKTVAKSVDRLIG